MNITLLTETHQKLRFKRTVYALLGGLFHTLVCFALWYHGLFRTSLEGFILLFAMLWIVHLIFPFLILTNLNLKFKDPSLTMFELLWSQISIMVTIYFVNDLRSLLLLFSLFSIVFGGFHLSVKQLITVSLLSILFYIATIGLLAVNYPEMFDLAKELTIGVTYAILSLSFVFVMSELSISREHLNKKKMELQSSLLITQNNAETDELTGLKNRRYILEILNQQRAFVERHRDYCFSVVMLDIDEFKQVNDRFGHAVGDKVLRAFAKVVASQLRKTDYIARLGGEEFLLVAPFTRKDQIKNFADRVFSALKNANFDSIQDHFKITCSIGITDFQWPEPLEETLARVDKAMYLAKNRGRNRIEIE